MNDVIVACEVTCEMKVQGDVKSGSLDARGDVQSKDTSTEMQQFATMRGEHWHKLSEKSQADVGGHRDESRCSETSNPWIKGHAKN